MDEKTVWRIRATAWELLAFSLNYPETKLAEVVASGEWLEAVQDVADGLEIGLPDDCESNLMHARAGEDNVDDWFRSLRAEATRLFVGASNPVVSPFEGVWRAQDEGVQALLFVNPHSMAVERFCKACGLGRPEGTNEPLDHVVSESELLQYLAALESGIFILPEGIDPSGLPGGSPAAAYETFCREHASVWMPRFAEKLAQEARHPFYKVVGESMNVFLAALFNEEPAIERRA